MTRRQQLIIAVVIVMILTGLLIWVRGGDPGYEFGIASGICMGYLWRGRLA